MDIWSAGCVLYELVSGNQAFTSDWAVFEYVQSKEALHVPVQVAEQYEDWYNRIADTIHAMLQLDLSLRPSARALCKTFDFYLAHSPLNPNVLDFCEEVPDVEEYRATRSVDGSFTTIKMPGLIRTLAGCSTSSYLAAGIWKNSKIWIFDAQTCNDFEVIHVWNHGDEVLSLAFANNDIRWLASGGADSAIVLWDLGSSQEISRHFASSPVCSLAFDSHARRLAAGCEDGRIGIWNTEGNSLVLEFAVTAGVDAVCNLEYNFWGQLCSSSPNDGAVIVWNAEDPEHGDRVRVNVNCPDGVFSLDPISRSLECHILTPSDIGFAVWSSTTGEQLGNIATSCKVRNVSYTPCGNYVIAWGVDNRARIWDRWNMQLLHVGNELNEFSPTGRLQYCTYEHAVLKQFKCAFQAQNEVGLWEYEYQTLNLGVSSLNAFNRCVSAEPNDFEPLDQTIYWVIVNKPNTKYATVSSWLREHDRKFCRMSLWDSVTGMLLWRQDQSKSLSSIPVPPSFSLSGRIIGFYNGGDTIILFDIESRSPMEVVRDSSFVCAVSLAVTPEGEGFCIATIKEDGTNARLNESQPVLLERVCHTSLQPTATYQVTIDEIQLACPRLLDSSNGLRQCLSYSSSGEHVILVTYGAHAGTYPFQVTCFSIEHRKIVNQQYLGTEESNRLMVEKLDYLTTTMDIITEDTALIRVYERNGLGITRLLTYTVYKLRGEQMLYSGIVGCVSLVRDVLVQVHGGAVVRFKYYSSGIEWLESTRFDVGPCDEGVLGDNFIPCWMIWTNGRLTQISADGKFQVTELDEMAAMP